MKKKFFRSVLIPLLFAVLLGFYGAKIVYGFNRVKQSVSNVSHNAYAIQYGVYTSADTLNKTMSNIDNYVVSMEDGKYYIYIGFTTDSKNLTKIRNVYDELGIDVYIKEVFINNDEFIIVIYRIIYNMKTKEVAEVLNLPLGTVGWKYNKAMKKARKYFKEGK